MSLKYMEISNFVLWKNRYGQYKQGNNRLETFDSG